jgi:hypothetical protein
MRFQCLIDLSLDTEAQQESFRLACNNAAPEELFDSIIREYLRTHQVEYATLDVEWVPSDHHDTIHHLLHPADKTLTAHD